MAVTHAAIADIESMRTTGAAAARGAPSAAAAFAAARVSAALAKAKVPAAKTLVAGYCKSAGRNPGIPGILVIPALTRNSGVLRSGKFRK